jgi:acyl-CoA thioester hydrolase
MGSFPALAAAPPCCGPASGSTRLLLKTVPHPGILAGMELELPKRTSVNTHTITIVPRYVETDRGGVVHHSVFPVWFEMGRTELLRANGIVYKDLEAAGVFFVVAEMNVKYRRPAMYDEPLRLETTCSRVTAGKVEHTYRLLGPDGALLAEGRTILACIGPDRKVRRIPEFMYPEDL